MSEVYNVSSTLELTMDALNTFIEGQVDLPEGIDALERDRRNSKLHVTAVSSDVGTYTPTAKLVGTVRERTIVIEDGEPTHNTIHQYQSQQSGWTEPPEADSLETETLEYVKFHGEEENILRNTTLRAEMFGILCQLASRSHTGYVEGVRLEEDGLTPVRYSAEAGEVPVELTIQSAADQTDPQMKSQRNAGDSAEAQSWTSFS